MTEKINIEQSVIADVIDARLPLSDTVQAPICLYIRRNVPCGLCLKSKQPFRLSFIWYISIVGSCRQLDHQTEICIS